MALTFFGTPCHKIIGRTFLLIEAIGFLVGFQKLLKNEPYDSFTLWSSFFFSVFNYALQANNPKADYVFNLTYNSLYNVFIKPIFSENWFNRIHNHDVNLMQMIRDICDLNLNADSEYYHLQQ